MNNSTELVRPPRQRSAFADLRAVYPYLPRNVFPDAELAAIGALGLPRTKNEPDAEMSPGAGHTWTHTMHDHPPERVRVKPRKQQAPFDQVVDALLDHGWSPVALRPGSKAPADKGWTTYCRRQPTATELDANRGRGCNVGIACGMGLAVIDIDTEDPQVVEAVMSTLPERSPVEKKGKRGSSLFYRYPHADVPSRQIKSEEDEVLVEVLGTGRQTVLPPSVHPDTGLPYKWAGKATLLDVTLDDLPCLPDDIVKRLEAALERWAPSRKEGAPQQQGVPPILTNAMAKRHRAYALKGLDKAAETLATMSKPGRNRALFKAGCTFAKYVHGGVIKEAELRKPLIEACKANGLAKENSKGDCDKTIDNALRVSLPDVLQDLDDRPNGHVRNGNGHANGHAHVTMEAKTASTAPPSSTREPIWPEVSNASGAPRGRSQPNIRAFLKWAGVALSYNAFTHREIIRHRGIERELDDVTIRRLYLEADALGLVAPATFFESVLRDLAHRDQFHPVREYLQGLRWDGQPRLDRWLIEFAGAQDTPLNRAFGAAHLIAAVRRIHHPGAKHDPILVLEGPQGIGKSTLVRVLAGDAWFSDAVTLGDEPKAIMEVTAGVWLAEIGELKGSARESERVKQMLSRREDRARLAYGHMETTRPRQFVFFGSINDREYLHDSTGNRRYWPVLCTKIDIAGLAAARDQLWAEAAHREAAGESNDLPSDLWADAASEQDKRRVSDPWLDVLQPMLEGKVGRIRTSTINQKLGLEPKHQNPAHGKRISAIMQQCGFERVQVREDDGTRVYAYRSTGLGGEDKRWIVE